MKAARLWKHTIENWIGDSVLSLGIGMAAIAAVLLASDIAMDLTGNK